MLHLMHNDKNGNNQDFNKRRRYDTLRSSLQKSVLSWRKKQLFKKKMSIAGDPVLILVEHLFNED